MKKIIIGMGMVLSSVMWFCTLVACGFITCIGEGKQSWDFTQYGFSNVISELSVLSLIIPIIVLVIGIYFIIRGYKEQ